jgi:hypothetical protein
MRTLWKKQSGGKELTLPFLGYGEQMGCFTKGNKYSGFIKWKEFLDKLSIFSFQRGLSFLELLTHSLAPWSRVLLEKLTGFADSKEIPRIYGTRKFITVLTSARQLSLKLLGITVLKFSHDCGFIFIRIRLKHFNFLCFPVFFWAHHRVGHDKYLLSSDLHSIVIIHFCLYHVFCVFTQCSFAYWYPPPPW